MVKGKQKRLVAIAAATSLLGLVAVGTYGQRSVGVAQATHGQVLAPVAGRSSYYVSKAAALLNGVLVPLRSLRVMQRAIALAPGADIEAAPTLALLAAPLQTTGLGPVRIGMDLNDLESAGLTPVPIAEASNGQCRYYRIQDYGEPIGLMAIDDKVLRVDIWPGSLTTTRSGIGIGSSEQDLVRVYGKRLEATTNPTTLGKTVTFTPQDPGEDIYRLVFETDDKGRVTQFRAGQFPSVTWAEGCF
ncbi:hypothetical protein [Nodosilinea nodulosa]|uniref:hypothetical protein n=1 Tax=Nodosilinea nodulosa TaxID=416001 RepID=UPI0012D7A6F7|nr:hypothetical protein [Nodosilinea nodulosa]